MYHNPPIPRVNEDNVVTGATTIEEAIKNDWPRRVTRVFIFDSSGHILIQKRSETIIGYPGLWDQAAGGHVDAGENVLLSAKRETKEELGISVDMHEIASAYKLELPGDRQFSYIYKAILPTGVAIDFDPHDVAMVQWMTVPQLEQMLFDNERAFVPAFVKVWQTFRDKLLAT